MSNRKAEARARAKAMREEAARKERRNERILRVGIVAGVVVLIAAVALIVQFSGDDDGSDTTATGTGQVPAGAVESGDGVLVGDPDAPVDVEVWFDFQCPYCGQFEEESGPVLEEYIDNGTTQVLYHPAAFLGEESERATNAYGCAVDEGKPAEYMRELFANQPQEKTGGYTNDDLIESGAAIGLTSPEFTSCVEDGTYADWGSGIVLDSMRAAGVESTPTVLVNGEQLESPSSMSGDEFRAVIEAAK